VDTSSSRELLGSLDARVILDAYEVCEDDLLHAEVELRNVGGASLEIDSDKPLTASMLDPLSLAAVGGFRGWVAGVGLRMKLEPGGTTRLPLLLGTHHGTPDVRRSLPPGRYLAQARVPVHTMRADNSGYETSFVDAPLVELRIVPKVK
jgi:hypothetical protein